MQHQTHERPTAASLPGQTAPKTGLRRIIDEWWERLYQLVFDRKSPDGPARIYDSGKTGKDYMWNTIGQALWGALFPTLTIVSTQLIGAEAAGRFNLAFTVATLLLFLGNYGVRTFQVSDLDEMDSFAAYVVQRFCTCVIMLVCGWAFCALHHYDADMMSIAAGAFAYRAIDAFADVFEGRLQQMDKLYLAGISLSLRTALPAALFSMLLLITKNLPAASIALAACEGALFLVFTLPLTILETPKSRAMRSIEVRELFSECFPAFLALFLFNLIESMPKFAMEGVLPYEDQVYFSAIYFPAQMALMCVGFVYKPQLTTLAAIWQDTTKRKRFDLIVLAMLGVCALVSLVLFAAVATVGIPLNGLLYATDFERFRSAQYLMLAAGGLAAAIDFLFQILTVLREQSAATRIYVAAFLFVAICSIVFVRTMGFDGAVYAYLAVMVLLLASLITQYISIRINSR